MSAYVRLLLSPAGPMCDDMPDESWLCLLQDLCVMITDMQAMLQLIQQVQEGEKALQKELKEEQQRLLTDKRLEEMQKLSKEVGICRGVQRPLKPGRDSVMQKQKGFLQGDCKMH